MTIPSLSSEGDCDVVLDGDAKTMESLSWFRDQRERWRKSPKKDIRPLPSTMRPRAPNENNLVQIPIPSPNISLKSAEALSKLRQESPGQGAATSEPNVGSDRPKQPSLFQPPAFTSPSPPLPLNRIVDSQSQKSTGLSSDQDVSQSSKARTDIDPSSPRDTEQSHLGQSDVQSHREKLVQLLSKYDPSYLPKVDKYLEKFRGQEDLLIRKLEKKYTSQTQTTGHSTPREDNPHRKRLIEICQKYMPSKLASVDATLEKYKGREEELFRALEAKYKSHSPVAGTGNPHRQRLVTFYEKHNPSKLPTVDQTLEKYKGREDELFRILETKYAPSLPLPDGTGPICFLDFDSTKFAGRPRRVTIQLFADKTPLAAENFRSLCTGEKGTGRSGKPLCYRNSSVHRIVPNFCLQGGDFTKGDGTGGESIYSPGIPGQTDMWGKFVDEKPFMQHSQAGLLSMANNGPNRNGSQFFITLKPLSHLNGKHVVFGKVLAGLDVVQELATIPTSKTQKPLEAVTIVNCGEISADGLEVTAGGSYSTKRTDALTPQGHVEREAAAPSFSFGSTSGFPPGRSESGPFTSGSTPTASVFGSVSATNASPSPFSFGTTQNPTTRASFGGRPA